MSKYVTSILIHSLLLQWFDLIHQHFKINIPDNSKYIYFEYK